MVRSASAGDIIEIVYPTGRREFHLVDAIGFTQLDFDFDAPPSTEATSQNRQART